ncbi:MAG: hypothetical protein A3J09_00225 [Candidatus Zambryskibacteria bacterium RIFCSPLOWO2_02_FULL_51_21]|uniref:Septum formation initiator n=1 Tax=Candidatus Zambryskibacteria bacterium RIFCSPHIGHO2_02_FULL_43_37 TaxID=1802749 RepID=A0A1G2THV8_9BACT|nr:MAG: hypothetical protein A2723_00225 [Candidatus Zambryskibacteria bacterium RIFCSPHIGHO2_01_FULL_52_18]OHA96885.1 MAG: hypothetical protein A3D49_02125 [Candidatus Zambryskibacteria bacterium RIFCSPHIGHO2_02_FULL_43_37]OHB07058.1 MAG: hypothetical protein A2944_02230 [Candidatus Zambryskibacteria bacterium RIFCSPLOWO2_01_FULL_52_12]OHB10997.1 MAG: hypothetical protein A3J09_00225 [Candidatus Zambryskibacteria bacterium RIFCSPLOWO2_02_FULL_51_21]
MKELRQRQRVKELLYSWPALVLAAILAFFLVKGAAGLMFKERESARLLANLESEAKESEAREVKLREGIARLQTETGIVEAIREKFSVTREGEHLAIIVDERAGTSTSAGENGSWYKRFLDAIMSFYEK